MSPNSNTISEFLHVLVDGGVPVQDANFLVRKANLL